MKRRITKVSYVEDVVIVNYEIETDSGVDKVAYQGREAPKPAFRKALDGLGDFLCDWMELPDDWGHNLKVREVSFKWHTDIVFSAQVTAHKPMKFCESSLKLKTPSKRNRMLLDDPIELEEFLMSEDLERCALRVVKCANAYIDGERLQSTLPFDESNKV